MRKFILSFPVIATFIALLGADIRRNESANIPAKLPKKKCIGYTIIEYGKGIDCNGDTLKLEKVNGIFVLAQQ